ncbi:hypothetical protein [Thalassobacillus pellis]|uniref:hypothetical protein n=1 Tax=Thalassobacillus pellis TaxID=748008 RepID=UPI0019603460|nr:hypothetical protein [Thalassobacillus pellis]MBM7552001.1 hypothetical protein [Thalassobacillus pellis]
MSLRVHFQYVGKLAEELLEEADLTNTPLEYRYRTALREKETHVRKTLDLLKQKNHDPDNLLNAISIVYKSDEVEKLHFNGWKRLCQQNKTIKEEVLSKLETKFSRMKTELEEAVPYVKSIAKGHKDSRIIVPALYRD